MTVSDDDGTVPAGQTLAGVNYCLCIWASRALHKPVGETRDCRESCTRSETVDESLDGEVVSLITGTEMNDEEIFRRFLRSLE